MSKEQIYSKQTIEQILNDNKKIKEIFNTVQIQKTKQEEFIKKISNFDKEFTTMLNNMDTNIKQFEKIVDNVKNNIKKAEDEYTKKREIEEKKKENENKNKRIEELKIETKYLQEYHKLMEEHNKISLVIEEQKIKKNIAIKELEKKYGVNIITKKKSSSKSNTEEHTPKKNIHPLADILKAKFKGARGED